MPPLTAGRTVSALTLALVAALSLTACGSGATDLSSTSTATDEARLEQQSAEQGGTEILASGRVGDAEVVIDVELTRHDGDLTNDLAASTLSAGGVTLGSPVWDGDPASGHHRTGTLTFIGQVVPDGPVILTLSGWSAPVVLRWTEQGKTQPSVPSS